MSEEPVSSLPPMSDSQVRRAESFRTMLEADAPAIYAWAAGRLGAFRAREESQDFAHEVFLRAARSHRVAAEPIVNFRAWMFGIAKLTLLEWIRARSERRSLGLGVGGDDTKLDLHTALASSISRRVAKNESLAMFLRQVDTLEPNDKRIVFEYLIEGRSSEELAAALGYADGGGVRTRAMALKAKLTAEAPYAADYFSE